MRCDLCQQAIILNHDDFVIREEATNEPGTTLLTYVAHQRCHETQHQPSQAWSFTSGQPGTVNFTWRPQ